MLGGTICLSQPLDLHETLYSGQVFHWTAEGSGYVGAIGSRAVYLERRERDLLVDGAELAEVETYLGLDRDLHAIQASFPSDDVPLRQAVAYAPGLRICRQPRWECLATFITSSMKQVAHIRQISLTLRERFGEKRQIRGVPVYTYPTPHRLAEAGEQALRDCGLGYRGKSLALAAERIARGEFSLEALDDQSDDEALARLCELYGVGEKIACCVLLFAYGRLASFPIDVWVDRVMRRLYAPRGKQKKWPPEQMKTFAEKHFGPYAGYAQQYLFHYARTQPGAFG